MRMSRSGVCACLIAAMAMAAIAGCARKSDAGDLMRGHASDVQAQVDLKNQLAKDWDRGQKLIKSGNKNVKKGEKRAKSAEKDLKRAKDRIERGKREIAEGNKLVQDSERRFREEFPGLDLK